MDELEDPAFVSKFAVSQLAGYGWTPGQGLGRHGQGIPTALDHYQIGGQHSKEGLGYRDSWEDPWPSSDSQRDGDWNRGSTQSAPKSWTGETGDGLVSDIWANDDPRWDLLAQQRKYVEQVFAEAEKTSAEFKRLCRNAVEEVASELAVQRQQQQKAAKQ